MREERRAREEAELLKSLQRGAVIRGEAGEVTSPLRLARFAAFLRSTPSTLGVPSGPCIGGRAASSAG